MIWLRFDDILNGGDSIWFYDNSQKSANHVAGYFTHKPENTMQKFLWTFTGWWPKRLSYVEYIILLSRDALKIQSNQLSSYAFKGFSLLDLNLKGFVNHHYLFGILWQAMIWLLLYDDDIYDKVASQKFICTITNIYFSITKGIILLISETTWFQRVQKATIELKLTNWMAKHFSLHDFYWNFSISAFFY